MPVYLDDHSSERAELSVRAGIHKRVDPLCDLRADTNSLA